MFEIIRLPFNYVTVNVSEFIALKIIRISLTLDYASKNYFNFDYNMYVPCQEVCVD